MKYPWLQLNRRVCLSALFSLLLVACGAENPIVDNGSPPPANGSQSSVASSSPSSAASPSSESSSSLAEVSSSSSAASVPSDPVVIGDPAELDTETWFVLINRETGLAMDIGARSLEAAAPINQWTRNDGTNQQFRLVSSGDRYYRLVARHSGLAVDVYERNPADGADIVQWQDNDGTNQQFRFHAASGDYYQLVNRFSEKALAPADDLTAAGTRLSQYTPSQAALQQWQLVAFEEVSTAPDPSPTPPPGECGAGTPHATVTGNSSGYRVNGSAVGTNYYEAINRALNSLTSGRSTPQRVSVMADGSIGANVISLENNTILEVCGTLNARRVGGRGAIEALGRRNVSVPFLNLTGDPGFGMRFRDVHNLHLGQIELRMSGGAGIRFERDRPGGGAAPPSTNVRMDRVFVSGTSGHGVETWHIDGGEIGTVIARNTGYAGLLLNGSRNINVGLVDGDSTGSGTGYATLRFANRNGRVGNSYPTNIVIDRVISRGGGRGLFCVSESGGARINQIDFASNGNNAILIENCDNISIREGSINGGGEVRLAARSNFFNNTNISLTNLSVRNTGVRESPCGNNVSWAGLSHSGSGSVNICR